MAHQAAAGRLVIGGHVIGVHPLQDGTHGGMRICILDAAARIRKRNQIMAARGKKAANGLTLHAGHRINPFIAIGKGMLHAQHRRHLHRKPAHTFQQRLRLLPLKGKGRRIGHMLAGAAPAAAIGWAEGLSAIRACGKQLFHTPERIEVLQVERSRIGLTLAIRN